MPRAPSVGQNGNGQARAHSKANGCDIALFGHTHSTCNKTVDGVLLVNPGSIGRNGTYAVLKISEKDVSVEIKKVG